MFGRIIYIPTFAAQISDMANHKATKKSVRKTAARRESNRYYGRTMRNSVRTIRKETDADAKAEDLTKVISQIDRMAKRGIIHKNKAANLKSKLNRHINAAKAEKQAS